MSSVFTTLLHGRKRRRPPTSSWKLQVPASTTTPAEEATTYSPLHAGSARDASGGSPASESLTPSPPTNAVTPPATTRLTHATPPPVSPLVQTLANDTSPLALRPAGGAATLAALCGAVTTARVKARPDSTQAKDVRAMRAFGVYCALMGTSTWRTEAWKVDDDVYKRECVLLCGFLIHLVQTLPGRARDSPGALPQSCMNLVYAVRRAHSDNGYEMVPASAVGRMLLHLTNAYAAEHGPESLLPNRKSPFAPKRAAEFLRVAPGTRVCRWLLDWSTPFFIMLWAVITLAGSAGFRKAELTVPSSDTFTNMRMSRAHLVWRLVNPTLPCGYETVANPSAERLRNLRDGDYAMVRPPPSKTDPWGTTYGNDFIYLPFVAGDAVNAAAALAAMEVAFPVSAGMRRSVPLFAMCATTFEPLDAQTLTNAMTALFRAVSATDAEASEYSFHSFRIGLATALLAAGYDYPAIKAHCRWSSDASVKLYGRQTPEAFAQRLADARVQTVTPVVVRRWVEQRMVIDGDVAAAAVATAAGAAVNHLG